MYKINLLYVQAYLLEIKFVQKVEKNILYLVEECEKIYEVVFFLFAYSPAPEFYVPTFRNAVFHLHMWFLAYTT